MKDSILTAIVFLGISALPLSAQTFTGIPEGMVDYGSIHKNPSPLFSNPDPNTTTYQTIYPTRNVASYSGRPISDTSGDYFYHYRYWAGADAGIYWFRKSPINAPLATGSSTSAGKAGFLGDPNTRVILGPDSLDQDMRVGGRVWAGAWLDHSLSIGLEVGGHWYEAPTEQLVVGGSGQNVVSRPVLINGQERVYDIAFPGVLAGGFAMTSDQRFRGLEANLVGYALGGPNLNVELIGGFRFLELQEDLYLDYRSTSLQPINAFGMNNLPGGTTFNVNEAFLGRNRFYGGQLGARFDWTWHRFTATATTKIAYGLNDQFLSINGTSSRQSPGGSLVQVPGGVLANRGNIGGYHEQETGWVPEATLSLGYWITPRFRAHVGYQLIYWSNVLRPGNQFSRQVDPTNIPIDPSFNPNAPITRTSPQFSRTDFWSEGVTFGFDFRF